MKKYKVAPEVREQTIRRIKDGSVTVQQAAKEHGVHATTLCGWLGAKVRGMPSILEIARLRKENDELLRLGGGLTDHIGRSPQAALFCTVLPAQ
jgi:transposase-like protein